MKELYREELINSTVAPLGISVDGFPNYKKITLFKFGNFLLDIYILKKKNINSEN